MQQQTWKICLEMLVLLSCFWHIDVKYHSLGWIGQQQPILLDVHARHQLILAEVGLVGLVSNI
jgi:hypothetical protein